MEPNNIDVENETINDIDTNATNATNAEKFKEIINNIPDEDLEKLSKIDLESMDSETLDGVLGGLHSKTIKYAAIAAALTAAAGATGTAGYFAGKITKIKEYRNEGIQDEALGLIDGYTAGMMINASGNKKAKNRYDELYNESTGKRKEYVQAAGRYLENQK